jgi:hypothetical protein
VLRRQRAARKAAALAGRQQLHKILRLHGQQLVKVHPLERKLLENLLAAGGGRLRVLERAQRE